MPITRAQCTTWGEDPAQRFGEIREFTVSPRVGDFLPLGGVVHVVTAVLIYPAGRDTDIDMQIFTRELDEDEYLEAVRHPNRSSRQQPEPNATEPEPAGTVSATDR